MLAYYRPLFYVFEKIFNKINSKGPGVSYYLKKGYKFISLVNGYFNGKKIIKKKSYKKFYH